MANVYSLARVQAWEAAGVSSQVAAWLDKNPGTSVAEIATGTSLTTDQVYWALLNPPSYQAFIVVPGTDDELVTVLAKSG